MSLNHFTQHLSAHELDIALIKTQLTAYFDNDALRAHSLSPDIQTACALLLALQEAQCQGHSYVNLTDLADHCYFVESNDDLLSKQDNTPIKTGYRFPELPQIIRVVQQMQQHPIHGHLLVVQDNRLFSQKVFEYEQYISQNISKRICTQISTITPEALQLFPQLYPDPNSNPWQSIASIAALTQPFYIINGGPGTGKTYTVLRTLLMLLAQAKTTMTIALCAPTGKAAQRVSESLINEVSTLANQSVALTLLAMIPEQATTVHRLLGIRKGSGEARYNATHPLPYDLLVVDEASMLDTALFYRLLSACRTDTRIILIGDTAQLPSVESGAVLHDLMPKSENVFSPELCAWIDSFCPELGSNLSVETNEKNGARTNYATTLVHNMRSNKGINEVANAIYNNATRTMLTKLDAVQMQWAATEPNIALLAEPLLLKKTQLDENLAQILQDKTAQCVMALTKAYYESLLICTDPVLAIEQLKQFRILTPIRKGPFGVTGINYQIEQYLLKQIYDTSKKSVNGMYHGRAILITQNDAQLGVFNGDSGVVLLNDENVLTAYIDRGKQPPLAISPYRLPEVQSLYAMTIHKTQGSEFDKVFIILPPDESAGITKELIYTGITRARSYVAVSGTTEALTRAIAKHHQRNTFIRILDDAGK